MVWAVGLCHVPEWRLLLCCRPGSPGLSWVPFLSVGGETRLWTWCLLASGITCSAAGAPLSPPWVLSLFPWVSAFWLSGPGSLCWGSAPSGYFLNGFKWGAPCLGYSQTCCLARGVRHTQVRVWVEKPLPPISGSTHTARCTGWQERSALFNTSNTVTGPQQHQSVGLWKLQSQSGGRVSPCI